MLVRRRLRVRSTVERCLNRGAPPLAHNPEDPEGLRTRHAWEQISAALILYRPAREAFTAWDAGPLGNAAERLIAVADEAAASLAVDRNDLFRGQAAVAALRADLRRRLLQAETRWQDALARWRKDGPRRLAECLPKMPREPRQACITILMCQFIAHHMAVLWSAKGVRIDLAARPPAAPAALTSRGHYRLGAARVEMVGRNIAWFIRYYFLAQSLAQIARDDRTDRQKVDNGIETAGLWLAGRTRRDADTRPPKTLTRPTKNLTAGSPSTHEGHSNAGDDDFDEGEPAER